MHVMYVHAGQAEATHVLLPLRSRAVCDPTGYGGTCMEMALRMDEETCMCTLRRHQSAWLYMQTCSHYSAPCCDDTHWSDLHKPDLV